jgi:hypothetical protein
MPDEEHGQNQLPDPEQGSPRNHEETTTTADKPKKKFRISPYQFRFAGLIFEGLLVFVGAVYSYYAWHQWQAMNAQLRVTNQALHLDQRAWVSAKSFGGQPEIGKAWKVVVSIKNTGKTFGKNFRIAATMAHKELADADPDFERRIGDIVKPHPSLRGVIAPNDEVQIIVSAPEVMTNDALNYFKSPTIVVLVFGKIFYSDIFGCDHWTTFCYQWMPDGTSWNAYGNGSYNETDDNCQY